MSQKEGDGWREVDRGGTWSLRWRELEKQARDGWMKNERMKEMSRDGGRKRKWPGGEVGGGRNGRKSLSLSTSFGFREQLPQLRRDTSVEDGHSAPLRAIVFIAVRFTVIAWVAEYSLDPDTRLEIPEGAF